jgi:long-chain acyl-CoA synthetase
MSYTLQQIRELSLPDFLWNTAQQHPNKPALGFVGETYMNYEEFASKVKRLAYNLHLHGIDQDAKVAIWGENSPNWLVSYFAVVSLGAVAVPILPDFAAAAVENIMQHSEAKIIFISQGLYRKLYTGGAVQGKTIILLRDFTMHHCNDERTLKEEDFETFCKAHQDDIGNFKFPKIEPEQLASIIYTSGTTGTSKGVMLSHLNLVANTIQSYYTFPITTEDRFLSVLPMSHTLEFTVSNLYAVSIGASMHYLQKPPTAAVLMPALKTVKPTMMLTVPLIIEKIFKSKVRPELTNSGLKRFLYSMGPTRRFLHKIAGKRLMATFGGEIRFFGIGGAKLDTDTEIFLNDSKFPYAIGYGLTETAPLLAGTTPGNWKIGSTGPAIAGVTLKIVNPDPISGEGEIIAYGPNVMKGYYKADEISKEVFTADGGFRTGDTGIIDKDGFLFIKGRIKNMILGPSGENIFPEEIEAAINKSEWVLESLVYELQGKIVARVDLNKDELNKQYQNVKDKASEMEKEVSKILNGIMANVNNEMNRFSKLSNIFEQTEPFIKTPTQKIKRFLYHEKAPNENPEPPKDDKQSS